MKLEHCKIEQFDGETSIELGFSVPFGVSAELVTEIGRRVEHFLAPLHTPAAAGPTTAEYLQDGPQLNLPEGGWKAKEKMPDVEVVTTGVATVIAPAKRTRAPKAEAAERTAAYQAGVLEASQAAVTKAEAPEPTEPVAEIAPAIRRTRAPAPVAVPEITDMDLAKAASGAAEVLGTQIVKDIIAEMGVKTVNEIEGFEKRQYFLGLLDAEKKLAEEEKANG